MLFDAIERAWTVVNANFQTDFTALLTAKGVSGLTIAAIVKRETAEKMIARGLAEPCIGIYGQSAKTSFADGGLGGKRDSLCNIIADLVIVGTDPAIAQAQAELGAEVLVKELCERVGQGGSLTFAGGLERFSVDVQLWDAYTDQQAPNYYTGATVTVPMWDREQTT